MKRSDLKRIIKPMVAECIRESLLEAGILSTVISEVVKGMSAQLITEQHQVPSAPQERSRQIVSNQEEEKLQETKKLMLKAIGSDAYGGVNIFEGTKPAAPQKQNSHGPLRDTDPNDSGVDISGIFNNNWSKLV